MLGDARASGLPGEAFDVVTARLALADTDVVAEAVRLVRPGGTVALHELDALPQLMGRPYAGSARLRRLLERAGLVDVRVRPPVASHLFIQAWGRKPGRQNDRR